MPGVHQLLSAPLGLDCGSLRVSWEEMEPHKDTQVLFNDTSALGVTGPIFPCYAAHQALVEPIPSPAGPYGCGQSWVSSAEPVAVPVGCGGWRCAGAGGTPWLMVLRLSRAGGVSSSGVSPAPAKPGASQHCPG